MDSFDTNADAHKKKLTQKIHRTLAHSYLFFFLAFIAGIIANVFYPVRIFREAVAMYSGFLLLAAATILIYWAQYTSHHLKHESPTLAHFCQGPYCFSRHPTHWGLFFLLLGFSLIINSGIAVIFSIAAFLFSKFFFIRKEEEALAQKYGAPYLEYKRKVRL